MTERNHRYPVGDNDATRAVELWLLLQQHVYTHAKSITAEHLDEYTEMFDRYWAACEALGMWIGENHPLDLLDNRGRDG